MRRGQRPGWGVRKWTENLVCDCIAIPSPRHSSRGIDELLGVWPSAVWAIRLFAVTATIDGPVRRFVYFVMHGRGSNPFVRIWWGIVGCHIGIIVIPAFVRSVFWPNPGQSLANLLLMCVGLAFARGLTGAFWGAMLVLSLHKVRMACSAGNKRSAARLCGIRGGGIAAALLVAHFWMAALDARTHRVEIIDLKILRHGLFSVATDFNLLCALSLILAARPLARGDWDRLLKESIPAS